ncbi:MAG TPA: SUMF1/EgtB/PvdO family nonheme iron enzyme, partial [Kofleriaceae bacterium]|nr:SUMF1/EgtB/PvdO family nonheme iron enzyme [Kofleriaceae bacterium]
MIISPAYLARTTTRTVLLPRFTAVAGGVFRMGSDDEDANEGPAGPVFVSSFWCSRTATSNDEFALFVEATGYRTTAERRHEDATWRTFATGRRSAHPVVMVSWDDAHAYTQWLSSMTGFRFRMPTEAEWEKAARGGLEGAPHPWGDSRPEEVGANFGAAGRAAMPRTVAVIDVPRNGYGLHIGGNVWEWIHDWYDAHAYSSEPRRDP